MTRTQRSRPEASRISTARPRPPGRRRSPASRWSGTSGRSAASTARTPDRQAWFGLGVLLLPALLASMDISVLFVAGPAIARALHPSATQWLWAMDIYSFAMAGLLIPMGNLADRYGRRRLLLIGAALFAGLSAATAYAPSPGLLVVFRALMAIGGATLAPSTLALIRALFPDEHRRRAAIAAWTVAFSGGAVVGPIIAGALLSSYWWGAVFLINVPVMLVLLVAAPLIVPESRHPSGARFDLFGAGTSMVAILTLVYAMKDLARNGFSAAVPAAVVASIGILTGALFLWHERRAPHPIVDLGLFRDRRFGVGVLANVVVALTTAGLGVLAFPFLQGVHGLTPLQSALWALPTIAGSFLGAYAASLLPRRFRAATVLVAGLTIGAAGLGINATVRPTSGLWLFLTGYTILVVGTGIAATMGNSFVLGGTPPERAGAASGLSETSAQLGSALGIAVLGTIASAVYRDTMIRGAPTGTDPRAYETLADAISLAQQGNSGHALLEVARIAYTRGVVLAALIGALLAFGTAVAAALLLVQRRASH